MDVEIKDKLLLTPKEASAYSGIGVNKIYELISDAGCDFVIYVGRKKLIKRQKFEEYINNTLEI